MKTGETEELLGLALRWDGSCGFALSLLCEISPSSGNAKHLVANQALDGKYRLNVFWSVPSLPSIGSYRFKECLELSFPIAQRMDFYRCNFAGNTNAYQTIRLSPFVRHDLVNA